MDFDSPEKTFTPEDQNRMTAAACLNRIYKHINVKGYSRENIEEIADDIIFVNDKFGIKTKGAVLLAAILDRSQASRGCDDEDLANYIGCTNIEFIDFHEPLRQMEELGIIENNKCHRVSCTYCIGESAYKAIETDSEYKPVKMTGLTNDELFLAMTKLFKRYQNDDILTERLDEVLSKLIRGNEHLLFCRRAVGSVLGDGEMNFERRVFLFLSNQYVTLGHQCVPIDFLLNFTDDDENCNRIRNRLSNDKMPLQRAGILAFGNKDGFTDNNTLSLSDTVKTEYFLEVEVSAPEQVKHKSIINCESIKEQQLFYNPREGEQIERLANLLDEDNFSKVRERLENEGLPKGFCAVFHGCPGSGKTASLKELARRTGRDLFWVDLSAIKSKWVGESEQNVKQLFNSYRNLVRSGRKAPIMAVNEADAIFTRRITNVEQSVDQMNNAITDIILNEMESLDGILIATTNLVGNMMDGKKDNAMERRFLFKVEFDTPSEEVRANIWKSKVKDLTEQEAAELAKRYTFSGGNIENIARKCTVDYVLSGIRPDFDNIAKYCDEEKIGTEKKTEKNRIGF